MNCLSEKEEKSTAARMLPNCITSLRIIGTAILLLMEPFTEAFYILYGLCGFSDVLDGWIARKTGTTSSLGSKLDSVADLLLYTLILLRIFPVLRARLPRWIWSLVWSTLALRGIIYIMVMVRRRRFASIHTYMNKGCGLTVFFVPYFIMGAGAAVYCTVVCAVAMIAAVEELAIHLCSPGYPEGIKSIFMLKKAERPNE